MGKTSQFGKLCVSVFAASFAYNSSSSALASDSIAQVCMAVKSEEKPAAVRVFEPYIGKFRSESTQRDRLGREIYFEVEYEWFDVSETIVRARIQSTDKESGDATQIAEAFYSYNPLRESLSHVQFFKNGITSAGCVESFNWSAGTRVTRAQFLSPEGELIEVRDEFELIDGDTWKNQTFFRQTGGQWKRQFGDTYKRI